MKITNDVIDLAAGDLTDLSPEASEALEAVAKRTNISTAEYLSGVLTDAITEALKAHGESKALAVADAFARADKATQEQIKSALKMDSSSDAKP